MILNEKNDFTFWIRYGISTNFGMIVLDYPKSEVTHCLLNEHDDDDDDDDFFSPTRCQMTKSLADINYCSREHVQFSRFAMFLLFIEHTHGSP